MKRLHEMTPAEVYLLGAVGFGSILLTAIIVICILKKDCWLHHFLWGDEDKCGKWRDEVRIRYPPDIYPASIGIYRENIMPRYEDESNRIYSYYGHRDSTYSSMSENSNAYESASPQSSKSRMNLFGITKARNSTSPESPNSESNLINNSPDEKGETNESQESNVRQPFFTFGLKYEELNGLVHIEFMEARNLPFREYLNVPCNVFFVLEIQPKNKPTSSNGKKKEMLSYRFVTKTVNKAVDSTDYSEKFLAQLSKMVLKDYCIRFSAFDQDQLGNPTELGSTSLTFEDFRDFTTQKLILSCSLKEPVIKRGEILVGLCYLPTAERLSISIMTVKNLNPYFNHGTIGKQSICFVRTYLLKGDTGRVIKRKKTTFQRLTGKDEPLFNESLVFDMPPAELLNNVLLVLVCLSDKPPTYGARKLGRVESTSSYSSGEIVLNKDEEVPEEETKTPNPVKRHKDRKENVVGKVAFGYSIKNQIGKHHWEKMIRCPRNVWNEWHSLK